MAIPPLTFRRDLARKLTMEEGDYNIENLDTRITDIENNPPTAIGISNITQTASTFTVWLSDGSFFGPFSKPVATIAFRGDWTPATGYFQNDLVFVTETSSLYFVTQNHISDASFDDSLVNSGENIYVIMIGPLGFSTLGGLEDVNFTFRDPVHGDVIRYDTTISNQWAAQAEEAVVYITEATYEPGVADLGRYFVCTHIDGCAITIGSVAANFGEAILPVGSGRKMMFCQRGGPLTFVEDDSTIHVPSGFVAGTDLVGSVVEIRNVGDGSTSPNVWHLYGLLSQEDAEET